MPAITERSTTKICRDIFVTFGLPNVMVTDQGMQFIKNKLNAVNCMPSEIKKEIC